MKEITARLWENKLYGTTYGKGQYRKAIYNGTLELNDPYAKYLVDFEEIADWFHFTKAPLHQSIAKKLDSIPQNEAGIFRKMAEIKGLYLSKLLRIRTKPDKESEKRHLMQFEFKETEFSESTLVLEENESRNYTQAYKEFTKDYYLNF